MGGWGGDGLRGAGIYSQLWICFGLLGAPPYYLSFVLSHAHLCTLISSLGKARLLLWKILSVSLGV